MKTTDHSANDEVPASETEKTADNQNTPEARPKEIGGREGPDPTRYGDWEKGGRCIDF